MPKQIIALLIVISFFIFYSPVYLQNRKVGRMADEDLKKINYEDWKKQFKSSVYVKLFSRIIWGLFLLSGFVWNFQKVTALGFNWLTVFVFVLGVSFVVWGIFGFRSDMKTIKNLK